LCDVDASPFVSEALRHQRIAPDHIQAITFTQGHLEKSPKLAPGNHESLLRGVSETIQILKIAPISPA
jgi:hypothetical protein